MQHSTAARASSPGATAASPRLPRIPLGRAMTALLLLAVISTAVFVHLIWRSTATRNVEKIVATLDAQGADTVRGKLTWTLDVVEGTAEIVRSILFQGTIKADDEVKREFLFLSLLREQPAIGWIGFGFPDGRFFGSHAAPDGKIEMVEIGAAPPGMPRPLRRDVYRPIPGDVMFEERIRGETAYVPLGAPWYRRAMDSAAPTWSVVDVLPGGFEPSLVVSRRVELYGKYQGVVMVTVGFGRLSRMLRELQTSGQGETYLLDRNDKLLATSVELAGGAPARLKDFRTEDQLASAVSGAISAMAQSEFRTLVAGGDSGPVYVSSFTLPFEQWRLLTAVPRSAFAAEIDRNTRRVLVVVVGLILLAAATAVLFATLLFTRPIRRLAAQLQEIERFSLERVRHVPTFLAELNDFSEALKRMAAGLSAFAKYMPLDVVQPLVAGGIEPRPGGRLVEVTVMFADLPGFTELTERLGPEVQPYLTNFLTLAVAAIHSEGGTVDKFIGDAVMAIWNAPTATPDHAYRACRAAAAIRAAMHALPVISPGQGDVRVRIGINTGLAVVGNIGSSERLSYTAIGDTVNLASRLVGVAKEHGVEIVLSEMTLECAGGKPATRPLGVGTVRGKVMPVMVHTLED
jgi:class 3 adenylate cyclase